MQRHSVPSIENSKILEHKCADQLAYERIAMSRIDSTLFKLSSFELYHNEEFGEVAKFKLVSILEEDNGNDIFQLIWKSAKDESFLSDISVNVVDNDAKTEILATDRQI